MTSLSFAPEHRPVPEHSDRLPSAYHLSRHMVTASIPLVLSKTLSPRAIRALLPEALAAYVQKHVLLSNSEATANWIHRHQVCGKSFMDVPEDILYEATGGNEGLVQDLMRVQATIRGAYNKSTRPPPSLQEVVARMAEMPLPITSGVDVDTSVDDAPSWDFEGPDYLSQRDDAEDAATSSDSDDHGSISTEANTNETLPTPQESMLDGSPSSRPAYSQFDASHIPSNAHTRHHTSLFPPLPSATSRPVGPSFARPSEQTNRNGGYRILIGGVCELAVLQDIQR